MAPATFPKVPTGIPGLDGLLGGGYTKNSLITLSGATGSGRTTFAVQFLVNGFRQNQEPGLYLSFDEPKFSIFANMSNYDWDLPEMERAKQVVFIEYPHHELSNFLEQESALLELIDTLGVERVVFDSITPLAMLSEGDQRRRDLLKLVNVIRRWGTTTLITAEDSMPADPDLPRSNYGVEALTDGFIHLGMAREGGRRVRTLEVVKMRGSAHAHEIHPCEIGPDGFRLAGAKEGEFGKRAGGRGKAAGALGAKLSAGASGSAAGASAKFMGASAAGGAYAKPGMGAPAGSSSPGSKPAGGIPLSPGLASLLNKYPRPGSGAPADVPRPPAYGAPNAAPRPPAPPSGGSAPVSMGGTSYSVRGGYAKPAPKKGGEKEQA
ncbi:MAG: hypothetical protein KGH63_00630 [Candidatus Micrarchaeota archaeon]|nr:hypothetical protein [Candidatus Micrarchaeota archaeon]